MSSEPGSPVAARSRRRARTTALAVVGLLVAAWLIACFLVVQHPTINRVTRADAVVVLGPPETYRIDEARRLIASGVAHQLVISVPAAGFQAAEALCRQPLPGVTTTCFAPSPSTTRGEAQEVARLAAGHGWHTVVVVTSKFHVSRARMIFDSCVDGRVEVVNAHQSLSPIDWVFQYGYQSAGYVRAFLQGGC